MKLIKQLISAVALSILASTASAQTTETSANLITNPSLSGTSGWTTSGMVGGTATVRGDGYTSALPGYTFSFNQGTIAQTYAINQALSAAGAGIQIHGFDYGFQYQIWCANTMGLDCRTGSTPDIFSYTATITNSLGQNIYTNTQDLSGGLMLSPASIDVQQRFSNPYDIANLGNFSISFTGRDGTFWGGNHGPTVGNVYSRAVYSVDPCVSNPQGNPSCPGYKTYHSIGDDSYAIVPIPFGFPLYGQTFTHSLMFDNGVVSFYSPNHPQRFGGSQFYSEPLNQFTGSQFYYSIMPLWSDLFNYVGSFYTQQSSQHLKYTWENISQFGHPDRLNTFSLEIRPTGYIGLQYQQVNIDGYPVTVGMVGNASLGEYTQLYRQGSGSITTSNLQSWSVTETLATDCSNPLNNINCPGYAEALFQQQCSANVLYSPACPGYAAAYFTQQCSLNTLYDPLCPGYATAYYNYQCSLSSLYHTGCPGYAQAYFDQQCGLNSLYNEACPGYAQAYFNQQCALDPLYNNQCPGYADAFYVQQCTLNPLYDKGCNGYTEAYAKKFILNIGSSPAESSTSVVEEPVVVASASTTAVETETKTETTVEEKRTVQTETTTAAVSVSPASAATAPVNLTSPATSPASTTTTRSETRTEAPRTTAPARAAPTTRQALAEQRLAAAREQAAQSARENPGETAAAMDSAESMEQQVEIQNVVLGAMGFVAGFDAYGRATLPDAAGYRPFEIYPGQRNIDTPAARGLLGRSDRLHQEMVDEQYK